MSSSNWAVYGFGLVLKRDSQEFDTFMKAYNAWYKNKCGVEDIDEYDLSTEEEFQKEMNVSITLMGEEYDGKTFTPVIEGIGEELEHDDMLIFWAEKQPDPFNAPYTKESIVEEFKNKIGEFLPDDFDYLAHIGYFSGCIYC